VKHVNVCVDLLLCNQEYDTTAISKPLLHQRARTRKEQKYNHDWSLKDKKVTIGTMHNNLQETFNSNVPKNTERKVQEEVIP